MDSWFPIWMNLINTTSTSLSFSLSLSIKVRCPKNLCREYNYRVTHLNLVSITNNLCKLMNILAIVNSYTMHVRLFLQLTLYQRLLVNQSMGSLGWLISLVNWIKIGWNILFLHGHPAHFPHLCSSLSFLTPLLILLSPSIAFVQHSNGQKQRGKGRSRELGLALRHPRSKTWKWGRFFIILRLLFCMLNA